MKHAIALTVMMASTATALAQTPPAQPPPPPQMPTPPQMPQMPQGYPAPPAYPSYPSYPGYPPPAGSAASATAMASPAPPPADDGKPKQPKRGDFDAGGQVRLPNGPDETGKYATFNWIAVDAKARYFLLDSVTVNAFAPLAVKKPSQLMDGSDPDIVGGFSARLDAKMPQLPLPFLKDNEIGISLGAAYMRDGAMLLSDKDFPKFTGSFEPGLTAGVISKIKLGSIVDFSFLPVFVHQSGEMGASVSAIQVPTSLILKLGDVVKLSADVGVYTGPNYSLSADNGGRITLGAALDVKIGKIITHAGAGFASLLTGAQSLYPTISDSFYIDLNVKFAK